MELTIYLLSLTFLTIISAFFSGSEAALFSLPSTKVKTYKGSPDPRKRLISNLLGKSRDLLVTVFMLNVLVNILLQNTASSFFGENASLTLKVGVPLAITLILGETIPKIFAMQYNEQFAYAVVPLVNFLHQSLRIVRKFFVTITAPVSRFLFFFLHKEEDLSREEMQEVLKKTHEQGILNNDELELVQGYLNLQEETVKECMRPREDILAYDINEPLTKLIYLFVDEECSRLPVYDGELDEVLGVFTAKNFFLHRHTIKTPEDIKAYLDKPHYVPETTHARMLLRQFYDNDEVIAIVVDEYGSISGLITYEDLVEIVAGEISDRRDEHPLYTTAGKDVIIASGKFELDDLFDLFEIELDNPNNLVTVGGWLTEQLGDIPKSGMTYETDKLLFQVLAADPNRIRRLYIRKKEGS